MELLRLKDVLGLTLDELGDVIDAEEAPGALRAERERGELTPQRRREILEEPGRLIDRQLGLLRRRRKMLAELERELFSKRARVRSRMRGLDAD